MERGVTDDLVNCAKELDDTKVRWCEPDNGEDALETVKAILDTGNRRGVTVGHRVVLHGCRIEDHALIGINSVILNGAVIGRESLIGANALVTEGKVIPERSLVLGSPARVVRSLTTSELAGLRHSAEHYVDNARRYLKELGEA